MARPIKHTRYFVDASHSDRATPVLRQLKKALSDRRELNGRLAEAGKAFTRRWIRAAAPARHDTARALNATPTGYLTKRAADVDSASDNVGARVIVKGAIFKRVMGPVDVLPKRAKMLTIPVSRESFGKRARNFRNVFIWRSKKGGGNKTPFLARKRGRGIQLLFALVKKVTLPQDSGLLPTQKDYAKMSEGVAVDYAREILVPMSAAPRARAYATR